MFPVVMTVSFIVLEADAAIYIMFPPSFTVCKSIWLFKLYTPSMKCIIFSGLVHIVSSNWKSLSGNPTQHEINQKLCLYKITCGDKIYHACVPSGMLKTM